jgi:hypothetical protein
LNVAVIIKNVSRRNAKSTIGVMSTHGELFLGLTFPI